MAGAGVWGAQTPQYEFPDTARSALLVPARVRSIGALNAVPYGAQNGSSVLIGPLMGRADELNMGEMAGSSGCAFRSRVMDGRDRVVGMR